MVRPLDKWLEKFSVTDYMEEVGWSSWGFLNCGSWAVDTWSQKIIFVGTILGIVGHLTASLTSTH